jgi:amidase
VSFKEYADHDALGLAQLVARGEVNPGELLDEALARTTELNPRINAVIHLMEAQARAAIAAGLPDGPFRGVPFLIKDLVMAYGGEPMRSGSRLFLDYVPARDEELVARHKAAGLVIFGKTNTPELGMANVTEPELFGPTRNPWDLDRTPGGSSGGSAAAVAAGIVPAAAANDGGGSIRTPASNCGLVGLKPSRGRNPSGPQAPDLWWGFVAEHAVTRTVRDSAALLDATCGSYPGQLTRLPEPDRPYLEETRREPGRLRIAFSLDRGLGSSLHPENRLAMDRATGVLAQLGHALEEVALPVESEAFIEHYATLVAAEANASIRLGEEALRRKARRSDLELATWLLGRMGAALSAGDTAAALHWTQSFSRRWMSWSDQFDVLVTPAVGVPPLPIGAYRLTAGQGNALKLLTALPGRVLLGMRPKIVEAFRPMFDAAPYTMVANVTGQPSLSLPLHMTADGLPMGILFTGRIADEATLFRLAAQLEQALPWSGRRAPLASATLAQDPGGARRAQAS